MTRNEMVVYELLKAHEGEYVSGDRIAKALYGKGAVVKSVTIRSTISHLRRKLPVWEVVVAKRGIGYKLEVDDMPF